MGKIFEDVCSCGEPISVEIGCSHRVARTDGKRPFYPDRELPEGLDPSKYSVDGMSVFRCRKCGECVDKTVPSAAFEDGLSCDHNEIEVVLQDDKVGGYKVLINNTNFGSFDQINGSSEPYCYFPKLTDRMTGDHFIELGKALNDLNQKFL